MKALLNGLMEQEEKLLNCVHCGFCLPACPTYARLGDEADSPRGRLHFMRAVVDGRLAPSSKAFHHHLDRCLGCRACESVCPSGVEYGHLLEGAKEVVARARGRSRLDRILPWVMADPRLLGPLMLLARVLRWTGVPDAVARRLPSGGFLGQIRLGMGMVAATATPAILDESRGEAGWRKAGRREPRVPTAIPSDGVPQEGTAEEKRQEQTLGGGGPTAILRGCVQEGLLSRVNRATVRVLKVNGYRTVEAPGQGCCGAIHAHTGDLEGARRLARRNIRAFEASEARFIAINSAGCGAIMKEYPHLLSDDPEFLPRAVSVAGRVRDVSELLGKDGLRIGADLPLTVTYDAPCHLCHAQKVDKEPLLLLTSIPSARLVPLARHDECCGGAGVYAITHPDLGQGIGRDKVAAVLATGAEVVATGNPGCMMQIGAGLRMEGKRVAVAHPVELLDESYRRAGFYSE